MKCLSFERVASLCDGRRIRRACFEERSLLPASAACVVANGMRESLSALFGMALRAYVQEPMIPSPAAWREVLRDAHLFHARGALGAAAIVLRSREAGAVVAAAFGEVAGDARNLSRIEETVLAKAARALTLQLAPVCGTDVQPACDEHRDGFQTYFEVLFDGTFRARIGVAVAQEPPLDVLGSLSLADLSEVELELSVRSGPIGIRASELLELQPGATLPMNTLADAAGTLWLGDRLVARGECGANGSRFALLIRETAGASA